MLIQFVSQFVTLTQNGDIFTRNRQHAMYVLL